MRGGEANAGLRGEKFEQMKETHHHFWISGKDGREVGREGTEGNDEKEEKCKQNDAKILRK